MSSLHLHAAATCVPMRARGVTFRSIIPNYATTNQHFNITTLIWKHTSLLHHHHQQPYDYHCFRFNRSLAALRSPDLVALEYADLNLKEKLTQVGHVRIRQHVNPLSSSFSIPVQVPDWNQVFQDSSLPLMVDIGSGSGRFLIWLAKQYPQSKNYLGLEIRQKLVQRAQIWVKELALHNIHFMFANAMVSFEHLVSTYPGPLILVSILCPDPHFKKRHHKRRVVQKPLVDSILKNLSPGGQVFMQSDVVDMALDMRSQFDCRWDVVEHIDSIDTSTLCDDQGWLLSNPMGIRTEREIHAQSEGAKIYRRLYQKRMYSESMPQ